MKIINRFVRREEKGRESDPTLVVQIGQAYEIADLVTRYVQGNPPDISVNQHYTKSPSFEMPAYKYPFGADLIDQKEEVDRQMDYANKLLDKDNATAEERARAREIRARVRETDPVPNPEPGKGA